MSRGGERTMDITLVTTSYDKVVHGTENDKKTGCGINLLRPENVTRFHRTSKMRDLKEITCENCQYYDRQSGCCSHPARRRGQLNRSADNGNQKNANEKLLVRSDRLNEKN